MSAEQRVSVCIPTFNRAEMLKRAVASVQAQTEKRIEIVISDNASEDNTQQTAFELGKSDPRIRYVRNATNLGMVRNWNRCLSEAKAPLMCLLNDDDTLAPKAVETARAVLGRHPQAAILFGASRHRRDNGKVLRINRPFPRERILSPVEAHQAIWLRNNLQFAHAFFRTALACGVGGFSEEVNWNADTDFVLRLSARNSVAVTPVELGSYHVHAGQLTGTANKEVYRGMCRMVERVMNEVASQPELAALRTLAKGEYLSRYAVSMAESELRHGRPKQAQLFVERVGLLGLPSGMKHRILYYLLCASLALPGGSRAYQRLLVPVLRRINLWALRLGWE